MTHISVHRFTLHVSTRKHSRYIANIKSTNRHSIKWCVCVWGGGGRNKSLNLFWKSEHITLLTGKVEHLKDSSLFKLRYLTNLITSKVRYSYFSFPDLFETLYPGHDESFLNSCISFVTNPASRCSGHRTVPVKLFPSVLNVSQIIVLSMCTLIGLDSYIRQSWGLTHCSSDREINQSTYVSIHKERFES